MNDINRAFRAMMFYIENGFEFADAHDKASSKYRLTGKQAKQLISMYDAEY